MPTHFTSQSTLHVAIIMDGNGRWASSRHLPRFFGHRAGVQAARSIVEAAPSRGIRTLTLYAFSSDNWRRPAPEVSSILSLFQEFLAAETARSVDNGIRISIIGRRDRLNPSLSEAIHAAELATAHCANLHLRIAFDYSARAAISSGHLGPDVDLLIRSGGEQRLSDFLLWESAYAELHFTPILWPDFTPAALAAALDDFHRRDRRFGGLTNHTPSTGATHHLQGDRWLR